MKTLKDERLKIAEEDLDDASLSAFLAEFPGHDGDALRLGAAYGFARAWSVVSKHVDDETYERVEGAFNSVRELHLLTPEAVDA